MGVAPTLISATSTPLPRTLSASAVIVAASSRRDRFNLAFRSRAVTVTSVTEQTAKPQPRHLGDADDEIDCVRRVRIDPAPMEADVHLDEDVDTTSGSRHRGRPAGSDFEIVDDEGESRPLQQLDHPVRVDGIQGIGQSDVLDTAGGHDLRFTELGAADADRTLRDLALRERDALVGLGVRPESESASGRRRLHALQILRHPCAIHEYTRRPEAR